MPTIAEKQAWNYQWAKFKDDSLFLFKEWIYPYTLDFFKGKTVLDLGCGGGQHAGFLASYAKKVVGIDMSTAELAREHNKQFTNTEFITGDIATITLDEQFDAVYCIGVIQHTENPDKTFARIKTFVKPGGTLIVWCYSKEGNWPQLFILEPLKKLFLLRLSGKTLEYLSFVLTTLLYLPVYTIYLLPLQFLPYYQYFQNFRLLSFGRNNLNVFDKLNAPRTNFISRAQINSWFNEREFSNIHIGWYRGVSYRASGTKR